MLELNHAAEGSSYGTPGFKVGGVLFARLHQNLDALVNLLFSCSADERNDRAEPRPQA
jgi:hypothetical protein